MRSTHWLLILVGSLLVAACSSTAATPSPLPTISLDNGPSLRSSSGTVTASAAVVPIKSVRLSFPLTGTVKTVEVIAGDSVEAGQALISLDTSILEAKVAEAQADLVTAQTQVRYLKRVGTSQEILDSAQADVDRAQAALDAANATLTQATLVAPFAGTVASIDISPGETVTPGQVVVLIGDLTRMQVETTDLSERDVPKVKIGQPVVVHVDALNQEIQGKIVEIAQQATTVGGDVVYKVTIELDKQLPDLRWGMSAEVTITTEE